MENNSQTVTFVEYHKVGIISRAITVKLIYPLVTGFSITKKQTYLRSVHISSMILVQFFEFVLSSYVCTCLKILVRKSCL